MEHGMSGPGSSNLSRGTNGTASSSALSTSMARGKSGGVGSSGAKKDGRALDKVPESSTSSWVNRGGSGGGGAKQWSTASADTPFGWQINNGKLLWYRWIHLCGINILVEMIIFSGLILI